MAIKNTNKKQNAKIKKKRKANWLFRFTLLVIAIPCLILAWILFTSIENTGEPNPGKRFDNSLNPAIKKDQVKAIKDSLVFEGVQSVEVNLKSATLRITIDAADEADQAKLLEIADATWNNVAATLPIETYFTNTEKTKMYDLEIHVYNFIPAEPTAGGNVYFVRTKTGAGERVDDWPSIPRNAETATEVTQ